MILSRIKKRLLSYSVAIGIIAFVFSSCQDWGETDPPSGNQIYPKLEKLVNYTFEDDIDPAVFNLYSYPNGSVPSLVDDKDHASKVLHLNGGYARLNNPLNNVKVQNGVSLTFWVKQTAQQEEGAEQDLNGALFSFQNENGTQKLFFTANGWLSYSGIDGEYEDNNPSGYKTGIMSVGEWHYVAMTIKNDGYAVNVDGLKKIDKEVTDFNFSKIVQFIASVPNMYIGYGSDTQTKEWMLDDLTIYRNQITDTQIKVPSTGGGEEENNYIIVGNEDYSTAWWSAFSDLVTMTGNQTTHYGFYNYTDGSANYKNWVLVLTNGKDRGETGYAEYFVLRADGYGWGDANYKAANITHNFNFDDGSFTNDMKGAYIDLAIKRTGNRADVTVVVTAKSGTVYNYSFFYQGEMSSTVGSFLTCEGAYLAIDPEVTYAGDSYAANSYLVGPADNSAGWWTSFSNLSKITGNTSAPFAYTYINNTTGTQNYYNWLLVVTNGKDRGEAGYAEYFVLRADAFGWGDTNYKGDNISASYDMDSFKTQMKGASCMLIITRNSNRIDVTAKVKTASGEKLPDYTFYYEGATTTDIGAFLTVEGASLDMRTVAYYPFLNAVKK